MAEIKFHPEGTLGVPALFSATKLATSVVSRLPLVLGTISEPLLTAPPPIHRYTFTVPNRPPPVKSASTNKSPRVCAGANFLRPFNSVGAVPFK